MTQTWEKLLFAHWPLPPDIMRKHLPRQLPLDTYDGCAWIGIVPFRMCGIRPRWLPEVPYLSAFPEINVRTYVVRDGKPGVYFFSLDVTNPLAVQFARRAFHLPYYRARMEIERAETGWRYRSERTGRFAPRAAFSGSYAPVSDVYRAPPGSIDEWLTERYCLYTTHEDSVYRGEIHHLRWPLQRAEAEFATNDMHADFNRYVADSTAPLLHYAESLTTLIWPLAKIKML
jgi:hypothetical protein